MPTKPKPKKTSLRDDLAAEIGVKPDEISRVAQQLMDQDGAASRPGRPSNEYYAAAGGILLAEKDQKRAEGVFGTADHPATSEAFTAGYEESANWFLGRYHRPPVAHSDATRFGRWCAAVWKHWIGRGHVLIDVAVTIVYAVHPIAKAWRKGPIKDAPPAPTSKAAA